MKKRISFVLSAIFSMLLLVGCSEKNEVFAPKSYTSDGLKVTGINVDVRDREIEVSRSTDNQIHIDYFESDKEFYDISVSDDNILTVTAGSEKKWTDYIGGKADAGSREIFLQIPDTILSTMILSTTNEDIVLSALTAGNISLSTNGGNISFDNVNVENAFELAAKNGNISGTVSGSYDEYSIACEIKKGESNLPSDKKDGVKSLRVFANNGDVTIDFQKP